MEEDKVRPGGSGDGMSQLFGPARSANKKEQLCTLFDWLYSSTEPHFAPPESIETLRLPAVGWTSCNRCDPPHNSDLQSDGSGIR
jgi:hypothetical protein